MTTLRAAVGLLTRFPVTAGASLSGAAAFGLVGAALGCAAAFPVLLLGGAAPLAAGALSIGVAALASGALHLDGLADTADALAAPDPRRAEEARKDPRIGAAGAVAVTVSLLIGASLVAALIDLAGEPRAAVALIVAFAGSRAAAAASAPLARGRVRATPSGGWFAAHTGPKAALIAVGTAIATAVVGAIAIGDPRLVAGLGLGLVAGALLTEWLIRRRDGLDGDGIGMIVEVTFGAILLFELLTLTAGGLGR
ncbi:MAG: adenosylcobinamide-GDP ribazoletransferase [Chloroflexota bacterium]